MSATFSGKRIVVTGATSGIGLAVAEQLVREGAAVMGVGRAPARCQAAEGRLRAIDPAAAVHYYLADLALQSDVRRLAAAIRTDLAAAGGGLDGLVNCAGTFTYWLALTPEGIETQWAVNHLAPYLLTLELLPLLAAAPAGRVVTVSSGSHYHTNLNWDDLQLRRHYNGLAAYGQTKLANVLFTAELNRRLGPTATVRACAADPGLVNTEIALKGTPPLVQWFWNRRRAGGISAAAAAQGVVYLLTDGVAAHPDALYWKHGRPLAPSRQAQDAEAARRLWEVSARLCGCVGLPAAASTPLAPEPQRAAERRRLVPAV